MRIATRDSALAVRQSEMVTEKLKALGVNAGLVFIKSKGDLSQKKSFQSIASVGIFTKAIDDAVLDGKADVGVHSLKDLPTVIHPSLLLAAVLKRNDPHDVIVFKAKDFLKDKKYNATIATGSARRKAQWLNKFPHHTIVPVRGNVDSRIKKLKKNNWDGIILAAAGLKRLKLKVKSKKLDWMIPAPGQGAIAVVARKSDKEIIEILLRINHRETHSAVEAERKFLNEIGAGCSTPVGALAVVKGKKIYLKAEVLSVNGKQKIGIGLSDKLEKSMNIGIKAARIAKDKGVQKLLESLT